VNRVAANIRRDGFLGTPQTGLTLIEEYFFSPDLCRIAQNNIRAFQNRYRIDVQFEIVTVDATDYQVQPDQKRVLHV
jgi:hypothetical protein